MAQDVVPEGEVWWIYSDHDQPWAGLRIAHFSKAMNDPFEPLFIIIGDYGPRMGVRVWNDVSKREGWRKIEQIKVPDITKLR